MYETALAIVGALEDGADFAIEGGERQSSSPTTGKQKLDRRLAEDAARRLFRGRAGARSSCSQALAATHLFHRDTHYLVRDDKVQIIDEYTGRIMPDRSWEQGLHQMIETKEGLPAHEPADLVARITYQRFFRRYLRLAGMTGTAREVARELWSVYRLPVVQVPTHRPISGAICGDAVYATDSREMAGGRGDGSARSTRPAGRCSSARARWPRPKS